MAMPAAPDAAARTVLVRARRVRTGLPGRVHEAAAVLIVDGVVRWVGPGVDAPSAGRELDFGAATLVPGLVDAHVHLSLDPDSSDAAAALAVDDDTLAERIATHAADLVRCGVTTARDLGAPLEPILRARAALAPGLRLLVAGAPVTSVGEHLHFFGGAVANAAQAVALVRRQVAAGTDWVKLVLSGGEITPGSDLRRAVLPPPVAAAAVTEAHASGRRVAVHAHSAAAARLAIDLGADTVEHCTLLDGDPDDPIAPAVVCPTANLRWRSRPDPAAARPRRLAALVRGGSALIAGTDAGIPGVGFGDYAAGLLALLDAGLEPGAVLRAATTGAAEALGLDDRGTLEPGRLGDLVALDADPVREPETLQAPRAVLIGGVVAAQR